MQHYWQWNILKDCRTQPLVNWLNWAKASYDKSWDVLWSYFTQDIEYFGGHPYKSPGLPTTLKFSTNLAHVIIKRHKKTCLFKNSMDEHWNLKNCVKHRTQKNCDHSMCIALRLNLFVHNYFANKNYIVSKAKNHFFNESEKHAFLGTDSKTTWKYSPKSFYFMFFKS